MAFTLSRNLKLRLDSNLTANARYNLERIDLLGSTFLTDSTDSLNIRSRSNINIEPNSADLGGSSTGGDLNVGNASHTLEAVNVYTSQFNLSSSLGLLDSASGGTKYLRLRYKSDLSGSLDTTEDRTLSLDLQGADRNILLEGNVSLLGGSIQLITPSSSTLTLPTSGTLATLAGVETLTNKTIDAASNTLLNITNSSISSSAAIAYSKLNLSNGILNSDINTAADISYSKLELADSIVDADINANAGITRSKLAVGSSNYVVINSGAGVLTEEPYLSKSRGGAGSDMSSVTFPSSGTLVTTDASQTLTNKTINGTANTFVNVDYSSLVLTNSILNSDISSAAEIAYSKLVLTGSILNADISNSASISRAKLAAGTADHVLINNGSGGFSSEATLAISRGGTGAGTATAGLTNLLPDQSGQSGKVLQTDGSTASWVATGTGSVTSVDFSAPAEFSVSGTPITTAGTITLTKANQTANTVWAGPSTGSAAAPAFRALVVADIPGSIPATKIASGVVDNTEFEYLNGVTSGIQAQLDDKQPLDADLTALAGLSSSGLIVRSGAGTAVTRTITAGAGISISDGDGVAGNPTIASTITQYTNEMAQDAVGGILTDTASIDLDYDDGTDTITATVLPAGVDHDSLMNFVSNEHVDHSAVQIATSSTSGLSGGGDITTTRNLTVSPILANAVAPAAGDYLLLADVSNSDVLIRATVQQVIEVLTAKVTATWVTGDGASKAVSHSLATADVSVNVYDIDSGEEIMVDSVVRTDANTVTLTASEAPSGSGWRIVVRK